jgi:hypothetical protein
MARAYLLPKMSKQLMATALAGLKGKKDLLVKPTVKHKNNMPTKTNIFFVVVSCCNKCASLRVI